jgi:hypothetical protein
MTTEPTHKCLQSGCDARVPASSDTGFCQLHESAIGYINLGAQSVAVQEPQEPAMRYCKHCGQHHYVGMMPYCPLNPNRPQG